MMVSEKIKHERRIQIPPWPFSDERERELLNEVLDAGNWWRMSGNKVNQFERNFADTHDTAFCLGVTNGTHALELSLFALGIGRGDEVILPAFTFISTATAILYCNAVPISVDVDPSTFCMRPQDFEAAITPKTKAVIPVHMGGHACDMDEIVTIARRHGIWVIEDAAHGHGAQWDGRMVGGLGDVSIFSFQSSKLMTCGEGGALLTNSEELYEQAFLIHGVGRPRGDRIYNHVLLGSNYRMNEFQAAILIAQLERLESLNRKREENSLRLDRLLGGIEGITPQGRDNRVTLHPHYMYMFYYDSEYFGGLSRQKLIEELEKAGIPAYIAYPAIPDTGFFKEGNFRGKIEDMQFRELPIPNTRRIAKEVVWIPHFTLLGEVEDLENIARVIRDFQESSM